MTNIRFQQARNFTRTSGRQIDLAVIHDMEAPEHGRTAENVADYFSGSNAPPASAHYNIDNNSIVQSVADKDVAWHAPGANHNGLGIEHAGYARQTRDEWLDDYGVAMLRDLSAPLVRNLCEKYDIPVQYVDAAGLRAGKRGITTHLMVRDAWRRTTHWDPGYHFPMDQYLAWVKGASGIIVPESKPDRVPVSSTLLRQGSRGDEVKEWQGILRGAGHEIAADGIFGPATKRATVEFQKVLGVTADGIVGPATRRETAKLLAFVAALENAKKAESKPAAPAYPGRLIRRGDRGSLVSAVQQRLVVSDQDVAVDGIFGPATEAGVKNVQQFFGLAVDGIVGPDTWGALWLKG